MYLRLIKVPPHVKILTSMGPTGPRFLAFLPSKSSGRNSSSSLLAQVLHKIYYILPTLLQNKYAISELLVVLMVLDGIFIKTSTCTCPAKEQVELLQVQVPTTTYKYLQVLTPNGKCHFKFVFLEPLPYYKYKYLPSKAVNGNSPGSAFSPPTTLCSPPACPHLSR